MRTIVEWFKRHRTSSRAGVLLTVSTRVASSLLALVWTRILLHNLGAPVYGLLLSFQSIAALGGLGDLGMGGAIALKVGQHLGAGEHEKARAFLSNARTLFLILPGVCFAAFLVLAPWLPGWFGFEEHPGAGSLPTLFIVGGALAASMIIFSYVQNLNYAALNINAVTVPLFLVGQGALACQCLMGRMGYPLWLLLLPLAVSAALSILVGWRALRAAQPGLTELRPLSVDRIELRKLLVNSIWMYLCSLGTYIFTTCDRLIINAWFGSKWVPTYQLNYKLCELALFVTGNLVFIALPKLTFWISSPNPEDRARVPREARKLNAAQTLLGLCAALVYLGINDTFINWWLGPEIKAPLVWQIAFALSLVITAAGDIGVGISFRLGERGLPFIGILMAACGLVNLGLSLISMRLGSIAGIAFATVFAQSILSLLSGRYLCRYLNLPWMNWSLRSWLLPVLITGIAGASRMYWKMDRISDAISYLLLSLALLLIAALAYGVTPRSVRKEIGNWTGMFLKQ